MRQRDHWPAECLGTVRIYALKSSSRVALRGPGFCLQEHLSHKGTDSVSISARTRVMDKSASASPGRPAMACLSLSDSL